MENRTNRNPVAQVYEALRRIEENVPKGANGTVQRIMREVAQSHEPLRQASIWFNQNGAELIDERDALRREVLQLTADRDGARMTAEFWKTHAIRYRKQYIVMAVLWFAAVAVAAFAAGKLLRLEALL